MTKADSVLEVVKVIRKIDEEVDVARGHVQLTILVEAGQRGEVELVDIARKHGWERKAIVDAAQKLRNKGLLISREKGRYALTDKGMRIYRLLESLALRVRRPTLLDSLILADAVLVVGTSIREWVPLSQVARELKVSERKLLEVITTSDTKLFKVRESSFRREVALTYHGQEAYKEILERMGLGPLAAKVFALLTATLRPQEALRRFMAVYIVITLLIAVLAVGLHTPARVILGGIWGAVSFYLAFLLYSKV